MYRGLHVYPVPPSRPLSKKHLFLMEDKKSCTIFPMKFLLLGNYATRGIPGSAQFPPSAKETLRPQSAAQQVCPEYDRACAVRVLSKLKPCVSG